MSNRESSRTSESFKSRSVSPSSRRLEDQPVYDNHDHDHDDESDQEDVIAGMEMGAPVQRQTTDLEKSNTRRSDRSAGDPTLVRSCPRPTSTLTPDQLDQTYVEKERVMANRIHCR